MLPWLGFILILQLLANPTHTLKDFRHISYNDLAEKTVFQEEGVSTYSQLLFDVAGQVVVVGARDNLYRLTLNTLTPLEHAVWPATKEKTIECHTKGQSIDDCHNYIKILLSNGKKLFTCGTNAFSPLCSWREIDSINNVTSKLSGTAMCPYSPHSNVTALLARGPSGGLFAGTPADLSGNDAGIYRTLVSPSLRTRQYDSNWLNDPQFVGSFETEDYVYFLFRESAVEYINCGKRIYSRIARICKHDPGSPMLMKDTWTTFSKARLNCSLPGEFPFYYDEIQGAVYQPDQGVVYATFTTPSNAIAGSAICAFNMSAIVAAFEGPFKHQEHSGAAWERKTVKHNRQHCGPVRSTGSNQLTDNQRYQLMDEAVQSATQKPLHTTILERFTHIAVDVTPTKLEKAVAVLYVATSDGLIKKISILSETMETCVVEIWGPLPSNPIILQYLKETKSLYLGLENALIRISTIQCHRHLSAQSCLDAQDPYCGWDEHLLKCTAAPSESAGGYSVSHWRQDTSRCPELRAARAGGWSAWGPWFSCPQGSVEPSDSCLCQTRDCDNPRPRNGGADCVGSRVRVTNCTVHGGWTAWSAWSSCGQSCGPAIKTRRRTCTNPAPQHGGRLCVGIEHEESFCIELPPCPAPAQPASQTWSSWGPWTACSKPCAGGFRIRKRSCEGQSSRNDGQSDCPGCNFQVEECNSQPCQEVKKYLSTSWLSTGNYSSTGVRTEKRYRFVCRAQTDDPSSVKVQSREEERHCRAADGSCSKKSSLAGSSSSGSASLESTKNVESTWTDWSSWSGCSQSCGGGTQYKIRQCKSSGCEDQALQTESRACNTRACEPNVFSEAGRATEAHWSCWSEWSECSVSCGFGVRVRARECIGRNCPGPSRLSEPCEMPSCESLRGWDLWSAWSGCDRANVQYRRRSCLVQPGEIDCLGPSKQSRFCLTDFFDNDVNALPATVEMANVSLAAAVGSCFAGFLIGLLSTVIITIYYLRRRKTHIPSSPHYISRQNPYVTVPLKEINTKRQPSFSGSINGTFRSGKNNSMINSLGSQKLYPKALEYESATLKRNSREQHLRIEQDQDKYY